MPFISFPTKWCENPGNIYQFSMWYVWHLSWLELRAQCPYREENILSSENVTILKNTLANCAVTLQLLLSPAVMLESKH